MDLTELRTRLERIMGRRGLALRFYDNGVINMTAPVRQVTQEDMAAFRAVLTQHGYEEAESWIATQGVSWLSDGVFAGVSFRVAPA